MHFRLLYITFGSTLAFALVRGAPFKRSDNVELAARAPLGWDSIPTSIPASIPVPDSVTNTASKLDNYGLNATNRLNSLTGKVSFLAFRRFSFKLTHNLPHLESW